MRGNVVRIGSTAAGVLLALGLFATPPAGATGSGKHSKSDRHEVRSERSDRGKSSCFEASGRVQGRSQSDPDGMSNGGADKPGCTGGFDADRDGNNGCGNDADREDDNNGRCGGEKVRGDRRTKPARDDAAKVKAAKLESDKKDRCRRDESDTPPTTAPTTVAPADIEACSCPKDDTTTGASVDTVKVSTAATPDVALLAAEAPTTTTTAPTEVLGATLTNPAAVESTTTTTTPTEVLGQTLEQPSASALPRTGAGIAGLALLGGLLFGGGRLLVLARRFLRIG